MGVPDVQTLEEIAPRGKRLGVRVLMWPICRITDLQQDVAAEFDELDPNASYEPPAQESYASVAFAG